MQATNFEFRFRFFIFASIYLLGFSLPSAHNRLTVAEWLAFSTGHHSKAAVQIGFAVGALIVAAAAAIRTWATAYLQGDVVHDMAMHSDHLVADGPYRYVRNPLYLGTNLLAAGIGFLAPVPNWIFLVGASWLFNMRLILREEAALEKEQAASYLAFKAAVPRLIPALSPRLPSSGRIPQWPQAWFAESFMWAFAIAMLLFAVTLSTRGLFVIMFGSLAAYAVLHVIHSQRQKQLAVRERSS